MSISAYRQYKKKKKTIEAAQQAGNKKEVERLKKQYIKNPKMIEVEQECVNK